jgi:hypothetical protein
MSSASLRLFLTSQSEKSLAPFDNDDILQDMHALRSGMQVDIRK